MYFQNQMKGIDVHLKMDAMMQMLSSVLQILLHY